MADVTVNLVGVAGTSSAGAIAEASSVSVTLTGVRSQASPGRIKGLPRPLNIGTPALIIPPPFG